MYLCDSVVEPWPNNLGPKSAGENDDYNFFLFEEARCPILKNHQHNRGCGNTVLLHAQHVVQGSEPSKM